MDIVREQMLLNRFLAYLISLNTQLIIDYYNYNS